MYRFSRTATVKLGVMLPEATKFAMQVAAHNKKVYDFELKVGVELFGATKIHWYADLDSLDEWTERNAKLATDKKYWALLESNKHLWVEGSLQDRVVRLVS